MSNKLVLCYPKLWGMAFAFIVAFSGYLEQLFVVDSEAMRAAAIISFTLLAILACLVQLTRIRYLGSFHLLLAILTLYSVAVAMLKGSGMAAVSPAIRLLLLLLVSLLIYNLVKCQRNTTEQAIVVFLGWCSFFIIAQTIYGVLTGGGILMNNAVRYYGSIESPIGFASLAFTLLCALGYFWVYQGGKYRFLLLLGLVWVVLMTSTRSISVMAVLVLWLLLVFRLQLRWVGVLILVTPVLGWILTATALDDIGVWSRITKTLGEEGLDGSTSFRIFILESFLENLSFDNIIFGMGLGNFHVWFLEVAKVPGVAPHFEWLWILTEFGLVSFIIYIFYGMVFFALAFYRWLAGHLAKHEFLIVLFFLSTPQFFLQLANPFYFYQFIVVFGVISGVALDRCEIAAFKTLS